MSDGTRNPAWPPPGDVIGEILKALIEALFGP